MLEKVKGWIGWVLAPLLFAAGYIWFLLARNDQLEAELDRRKAEEAMGKVKDKLFEQGEKADGAEKDFDSAYDDYARARDALKGSGDVSERSE